jgi:hypothetical protein
VIRHSLGSLDVGSDSPPPTLGFVAACPRLTKLTVICPHPNSIEDTETGYLLDPVGSVLSATSELVNACKALPDFDTFQIVHGCGLAYVEVGPGEEQRRWVLRENVDGAKDLAINCLKEPETGYREGVGMKKTTVRVIELLIGSSSPNFYLISAECVV